MRRPGGILKALIVPVLAALASVATADEGLWTFDRLPRDALAARRGATLDDAWLGRAQAAAARLDGNCSATLVSPRGLLITSRACVEVCLAENTTASANLAQDGFASRTNADEKRCRRARAQVLAGTEDITGQILLATSGLDPAAAAVTRDRELARLEQACEEAGAADPKAQPVDCEPVALQGGGEYRLYKYRNYDDLRLAFAPERSVARYAGGDFDFPRLAFDVAFLRAYADGRPAETPAYTRVNFAGPGEREALFVAGHPAATERSTTLAELLTARDTTLKAELLEATELRGRYAQFALTGASAREHIALPLARLDRELTFREAMFTALLGEPQIEARRSGEATLRQRISQDPDLRLSAGSAFDEIATAQQALRELWNRRSLIEGADARCRLCVIAHLVVRAALERQKPDAERRPAFRTLALPRIDRELASTEAISIDVEVLHLGFALERLRDRLGPSDPLVAKILGDQTPAAVAERAISRTRLIDPAFRAQFMSSGAGAVVASDDPLIAIVRELEAAADTIEAAWQPKVDAPMRRAKERLARAQLKFADSTSYPDATGTLRLSSGAISGWTANGQAIAPRTTLAQVYERAAATPALRLPPRWLEAKDRINGAAGLNFAIDNDTGGGCGGCAVLSASGELLGVVVDGNRASAGGRYWYDATAGRAIGFDAAALKEVLLKVYRTDELMKEMVIAR
ncbi:MAG TPA: S46 family peptidase [Steroidobacteraceae bacterium]|nr:S46 family peptidase [Steroidobacteraceae bacterium]